MMRLTVLAGRRVCVCVCKHTDCTVGKWSSAMFNNLKNGMFPFVVVHNCTVGTAVSEQPNY